MVPVLSRALAGSRRNMKHMQKRLRNDELRILRGEVEVDEAQVDNQSADLDTSGSEDICQQPRQTMADFVSLKERRSMQTTDQGTQNVLGYNHVLFRICRLVSSLPSMLPHFLWYDGRF